MVTKPVVLEVALRRHKDVVLFDEFGFCSFVQHPTGVWLGDSSRSDLEVDDVRRIGISSIL